jgi:hypothetical protein
VPGHPSPALAAAYELLQDGEWHDYRVIVAKCAQAIPPGVAYRKSEELRLASTRRHDAKNYRHPETRKIPRTDEQLITYGAMAIVRQTLSGSVMFEIEPRGTRVTDGPKRIRLKPGSKMWRPPDG